MSYCYDQYGNPDFKLIRMRREGHKIFDKLWKSGLTSRQEAYKWLSKSLHISLEDCHFGDFDRGTCARAIDICKKINYRSLGL